MTRKDYVMVQSALGYTLRDIKQLTTEKPDLIGTSDAVFWFTAENIALALKLDNPNFDEEQFKQMILEVSEGVE